MNNIKTLIPIFETCQKLVKAGVLFKHSYFLWVEINGKVNLMSHQEARELFDASLKDPDTTVRVICPAPLVGEMGEWLKDADLELPSWSTENQGWCVEGAKKGFDTEAEARAKTIVFFKNDVSPKCSYLWPNGYGFGR